MDSENRTCECTGRLFKIKTRVRLVFERLIDAICFSVDIIFIGNNQLSLVTINNNKLIRKKFEAYMEDAKSHLDFPEVFSETVNGSDAFELREEAWDYQTQINLLTP